MGAVGELVGGLQAPKRPPLVKCSRPRPRPAGWRLEVLEAPRDEVVRMGGQAHFSCSLSEAVPVGEATWYINGAAVQPNDADWTVTAEGSHHALLLRSAQPHHAGEVTFAARDAVASARLTVLGGWLAHWLQLRFRVLLCVGRGGRFQPQRLLGAFCGGCQCGGGGAESPTLRGLGRTVSL